MTGESIPIDKHVGDEVLSGTINQLGAFEMRANKIGADSAIQRMVKFVESSDANQTKIVGLADKWATWIVAIMMIVAMATFLITDDIIRAVTVLVVFCPCAFILATPTAVVAAIGNLTKHGILVQKADAIERLSSVTHISFDKTGTLTLGKPEVISIDTMNPTFSGD
jgi:P-type E1-E2 ATPase